MATAAKPIAAMTISLLKLKMLAEPVKVAAGAPVVMVAFVIGAGLPVPVPVERGACGCASEIWETTDMRVVVAACG